MSYLEYEFDPNVPSSEWEALQARTAPAWARIDAQMKAMQAEYGERVLELARWEDDGGLTGPLPLTWRDACLVIVHEYGRKYGD